MAEAVYLRDEHERRMSAIAAVASGEVHQKPDGRAYVYTGLNAAAVGDSAGWVDEGVFTVAKTTSLVFLDGQEVFWDHSANAAHIKSANDRDFFLGSAVGDAAAADTTMAVRLNVKPTYLIDMARDHFDTALVAGGLLTRRGGSHTMAFTAVAEAQKADMLSSAGFAVEANAIVEGMVEIVDDGDAAAIDFNIGVANATHATSADTITESCFIHTDANAVNILAESDDGTTEVAATDTTVDYVLGTPFHFMMDLRNTSDIQIYIDGVNVLPATVFKLNAATGPLKLLAHLEKTSDDETADYQIHFLRARIMQD